MRALSGNNLSGIALQFATQNGQIATQIQNCVADFVHSPRDFNNFVAEKPQKLKIAVQILNSKIFPVKIWKICFGNRIWFRYWRTCPALYKTKYIVKSDRLRVVVITYIISLLNLDPPSAADTDQFQASCIIPCCASRPTHVCIVSPCNTMALGYYVLRRITA